MKWVIETNHWVQLFDVFDIHELSWFILKSIYLSFIFTCLTLSLNESKFLCKFYAVVLSLSFSYLCYTCLKIAKCTYSFEPAPKKVKELLRLSMRRTFLIRNNVYVNNYIKKVISRSANTVSVVKKIFAWKRDKTNASIFTLSQISK